MTTIPSARQPVTPAARSVGRVAASDVGLLAIRLIVGLVFIYHGSHKLFMPGGLHMFGGMLGGMGVPLPMVSAFLSACVEFFGGIAILLGFGVRIALIPMVFNMLVAILLVHRLAFSGPHGMEFPLTLAVVLLGLSFTGPGKLSLAGLLPYRSPEASLDMHR